MLLLLKLKLLKLKLELELELLPKLLPLLLCSLLSLRPRRACRHRQFVAVGDIIDLLPSSFVVVVVLVLPAYFSVVVVAVAVVAADLNAPPCAIRAPNPASARARRFSPHLRSLLPNDGEAVDGPGGCHFGQGFVFCRFTTPPCAVGDDGIVWRGGGERKGRQ